MILTKQLPEYLLPDCQCPALAEDAAGDLWRQAMSQLTGDHHDLSAVMAFMRDEVAEDMTDIEREISPHI